MVLFILILFIPVLSNTFLDENKQEKENEMAKTSIIAVSPFHKLLGLAWTSH
jgi:hypothetical protein